MVKGPYGVVWTRRSQQHLKQAYDHISQDSPRNAAKVIDALVAAVEKAATNPELYGPDKYKSNNAAVTGLLRNTITGYPTGLPKISSGFCGCATPAGSLNLIKEPGSNTVRVHSRLPLDPA